MTGAPAAGVPELAKMSAAVIAASKSLRITTALMAGMR
jgi:hypothetical protein